MSRPFSELPSIGATYGFFTYIGGHTLKKNYSGRNQLYILVRCECGFEGYRRYSDLKIGKITACGCKMGGHATMGNLSRTKEYRAWVGMIKRCYDPKYKLYHRYGGRGIKVCRRWRHSLNNFIKDMGLCPPNKTSLDRYPNNNGNYRPGNCRWATDEEQSNNRSTNRVFKINGQSKTLKQWADIYNISYRLVWARLFKGKLKIIDALTRPLDQKQSNNSRKKAIK